MTNIYLWSAARSADSITIRGVSEATLPIRVPNVKSIEGNTPWPIAIDRASNRYQLVGHAPSVTATARETDTALDKAPLPEAA